MALPLGNCESVQFIQATYFKRAKFETDITGVQQLKVYFMLYAF